jgi:hypothetical protein
MEAAISVMRVRMIRVHLSTKAKVPSPFMPDDPISDAARDPSVQSAIDFLRAHARGDLRFDEHIEPVKYVIAPNGRLVISAMVAMLRAIDTVLVVPEDRDDAMEVMVSVEEFDERGPAEIAALADRWRIYHGEPKDVRWGLLTIDAARFKGMFIDGEGLQLINPLADVEAQICREMNREHIDALRRLCATRGNMEVENPIMVGLDPHGLDIRAMFDIVRVPFARPAMSADDARGMIMAG